MIMNNNDIEYELTEKKVRERLFDYVEKMNKEDFIVRKTY